MREEEEKWEAQLPRIGEKGGAKTEERTTHRRLPAKTGCLNKNGGDLLLKKGKSVGEKPPTHFREMHPGNQQL